MSKEIYEEWIKINIELNNRLEELKKVNLEREELIKEAEERGLTEDIKKRMEESVNKYEILLEEVKVLNLKSKHIKESM